MRKIRIDMSYISKLHGIWVACLLFPLLLASCEASEKEAEAATEGDFIFRLSLPPALSVSTRAGDIGGISINDVWVIQFDMDDKMIAAKNFGASSIKQATNENGSENKALLQVETDGFTNINSTFRVIGNFGSNHSALKTFSQTTNAAKADLQKITNDFSSSYTTETNLLVSGDIEYERKSDNDQKAVVIAPLSFAYAWLTVKWTSEVAYPAKFELRSIKAYGLPATLAIDSRAGAASGVYPETATGSCTVKETSTGSLSEGGSYHFYMPENLRGIGCGVSFQQKNIADYGPKNDGTAPTLGADGKPADGGSLANCTYIDLEGLYYYANSAGTDAVTGAVAARYRLYLGGNLMNDYNIRRGYHYTVTVEISGINSADVRVTITDGAVVVFDKVDTITKEVDFR
jgi:hypothetical protein